MTKAYIRNPGGDKWMPAIINGYEDINAAVGGFIEAVPIASGFTLYCNEEGKLTNLDPIAYWVVNGEPHDVLVGSLVLIGPPDEEGEDTDVTPEMLDLVGKHLAFLRKRKI